MEVAGFSMAMGAFLAGVMLAESSYRHELEADIEPFRGILLGLFFMAVGLSLRARRRVRQLADHPDRRAADHGWSRALVIYALCRIDRLAAQRRRAASAFLLSQGGEFGFVLFTAAAAAGLFSSPPRPRCWSPSSPLPMALTPHSPPCCRAV